MFNERDDEKGVGIIDNIMPILGNFMFDLTDFTFVLHDEMYNRSLEAYNV